MCSEVCLQLLFTDSTVYAVSFHRKYCICKELIPEIMCMPFEGHVLQLEVHMVRQDME